MHGYKEDWYILQEAKLNVTAVLGILDNIHTDCHTSILI